MKDFGNETGPLLGKVVTDPFVYDKWFRMGASIWKGVYGDNEHHDERAYGEVMRLLVHSINEGRVDPSEVGERLRDSTHGRPDINALRQDIVRLYLGAAKWVDGGCRTIVPASDKYFAAMAMTHVSPDAIVALHVPWPAFAIRLPPGMIVGDDNRAYSTVLWAQFEGLPVANADMTESEKSPISAWYQLGSDDDNVCLHDFRPNMTILDLMVSNQVRDEESLIEHSSFYPESASDERIRDLVKRASLGLLFTMEHTNNWQFGGKFDRAGQGFGLRSAPPAHRTIFIGKEISVDVRSAVQSDARKGTRSTPTVQTLVRGHLKRQVCGVGRSGRKVIWIEPYWRGPEDAPILARPYLVGPKKDAEKS